MFSWCQIHYENKISPRVTLIPLGQSLETLGITKKSHKRE